MKRIRGFHLMKVGLILVAVTQVGLVGRGQELLEPFEDPALRGWDRSPVVEVERGVLYLPPGGFAFHPGEWSGDLRARVQVSPEGALAVSFRISEAGGYHLVIGFGQLLFQREVEGRVWELARVELPPEPPGSWLDLGVQSQGGVFVVHLFDEPILEAVDPDPLPPGGVALEALGEGLVQLDELGVYPQEYADREPPPPVEEGRFSDEREQPPDEPERVPLERAEREPFPAERERPPGEHEQERFPLEHKEPPFEAAMPSGGGVFRILTTDLAVTDLFPEHLPRGRVIARITNRGPNPVTEVTVLFGCSVWSENRASGEQVTRHQAPAFVQLSLVPDQTVEVPTHVQLNSEMFRYHVSCQLQADFSDPKPANNHYSETIPPMPPGPAYEAAQWVRLGGPLGGLGYDIRIDPHQPGIMYVTDAWAGIHKSTDGGETWFPINRGIDARSGPSNDRIPAFSLTIDPNAPNIIWAGMQDHPGVYRSEDGGNSWHRTDPDKSLGKALSIRGISIEPGNSNVVYAAGEISSWGWGPPGNSPGRRFDMVQGVVYKTTSWGESWQEIWRGNNLARYVLIDPRNPQTLYLSTGIFDREAANSNPKAQGNLPGGEGVLKSIDGGYEWFPINNGLGNLYVGSLYLHPFDSNILLAGTGNNTYPEGGGIYLTVDGGMSWEHVAGNHITSVEFATSEPQIAYAGGRNDFYRSQDGGWSWQRLSRPRGIDWGPDDVHPGFPIDFQVDPGDANRIFANGYGGGNFLSTDGGASWKSASNGYTGAHIWDVSMDPNRPGTVYAMGRTGPFRSNDGGATWQGLLPTSSRPARVLEEGARLVIDPHNPEHQLMSSSQGGQVFSRSGPGGALKLVIDLSAELNRLKVPRLELKRQGMQAIAFAPSQEGKVYGGFGTVGCVTGAFTDICRARTVASIFLSKDGGHNWERIDGTALDGLSISDIVVHPHRAEVAWAATGSRGVFRTRDGGYSWEPLEGRLASLIVLSLAVDPLDPDRLYAGTDGGGVFTSSDGGTSWVQTTAGMESNETVGALAIDPLQPNVVYAGSWLSGVYLSHDWGTTWHLLDNGLRTRTVRALSLSADGTTLYAGTRGEGVYRLSTLPEEMLR